MPGTSNQIRRKPRACFFLILISALALLCVHTQKASALTGQSACPTSTDTATMTAWCTARFGGYDGTLSATAWDRNRESFSCVCNGNAGAALTIMRLPTSMKLPNADRQLGRAVRATSAITLTDAPSAFLGKPKSVNTTESRSVPTPSEVDKYDGSFISSSSSWPLDNSSPSSSSKRANSNSNSNSDSNVTGLCTWGGVFTQYPDGVKCMATTGVCPRSCSDIPADLCNNAYTHSTTCTSGSAYVVAYTCLTCNGRNYTISSNSINNCTRYYTSADTCDAQATCNGHGCCIGGTSSTSVSGATCTCFSDGTNGYYTGSTCSSCQTGYTENSAHLCLIATNRVQIILASIAKTWTMVAPNMAVLFLFVIFGVTRKLNTSDRPFDLTGLRRANLSTVQVARRRQQSLFHSKYVPMRPAKSRSFANPHQPQTRGPPAF